jgi:membrane associated rhomboid family serine protease
MGIYDRDYVREDQGGWLERSARTMVVNLIIINVVVYLAEIFFTDLNLDKLLGVSPEVWRYPLGYFRLLTYGFAHDPKNAFHVLFNMYALWLFGQELEQTLGRKEFLSFYLSTIVLAGVGWVAVQNWTGSGTSYLVGASGGVMGVIVVYAMRNPHRTIYVWFIPVPVWLFAGFIVLQDVFGAMRGGDLTKVAYECHLSGALAGFIYQKYQWHLGRLVNFGGLSQMFRRGPKLRVHREADAPPVRDDLENQVDRLLDKIQRQGEGSLTAAERATLEEASRRYRRRKQ